MSKRQIAFICQYDDLGLLDAIYFPQDKEWPDVVKATSLDYRHYRIFFDE
jgi:hypothetical protein